MRTSICGRGQKKGRLRATRKGKDRISSFAVDGRGSRDSLGILKRSEHHILKEKFEGYDVSVTKHIDKCLEAAFECRFLLFIISAKFPVGGKSHDYRSMERRHAGRISQNSSKFVSAFHPETIWRTVTPVGARQKKKSFPQAAVPCLIARRKKGCRSYQTSIRRTMASRTS